MKKIFSILMVSSLLLACNNSQNSADENTGNTENLEVIDMSDMNEFNLTPYGLNLSFMLPEVQSSTGSSIEPSVQHEDGDYLWFVDIGAHFHLVIEDFGKEKNKVQDEKNKLDNLKDIFNVEYLIDEPNLIMYKRKLQDNQGGKTTYHCYGETEVDGYTVVLRSSDDGGLKPVINDMVNTIKSAKQIAQS